MSTCVYFCLYFKQIHLREVIPKKGPGEAKWTNQPYIPAATLLPTKHGFIEFIFLMLL